MIDAAAELAAALRPVGATSVELRVGGGNYVRIGGQWLYTATGYVVPGAADVTLGQRYAAAPQVERNGRNFVLLDVAWLSGSEARRELSWSAGYVVDFDGARPRLTAAVPAAEFARRADVVVGLTAPELDAANLLTASVIAEALGVTRSTVNAYHSRGQMPPPAVVLNRRLPLWPQPVIDHWLAGHRRRHHRVVIPR